MLVFSILFLGARGKRMLTYKSIHQPTEVYKNTDLGGFLLVTINHKSKKNGGLDLITETSDGGANTWSDIPAGSVLQLESPSQ